MALTVRELVAKLGLKVDKGSFDKAEKAMKSLKQGAKTLAIGVAGAAAGLVVLAKSAADTADVIGKGAGRLRISTDLYQALSATLTDAGGSMSLFERAMARVNSELAKGKDASKFTKEGLKDLGLSLEDMSKLNTEERMLAIINALSKLEGQAREDAGFKLFGKNWQAIGKSLDDVTEGSLLRTHKVLKDTGQLIDKETIKSGEDLHDVFDKVGRQVDVLKTTIGVALLPVIKDISKRFGEWVSKNKDLIKQKAEKFVTKVVEAMEALAPILVTVAENVDLVVAAWALFKGLSLIKLILGIVAELKLLGITQSSVAVKATVMWGAITGPVGLVILAIAAVAAAAYLIWDNFDAIKDIAAKVWKWVKIVFDVAIIKPFMWYIEKLIGFYTWIWDKLVALKDVLVDAFDVAILKPFNDLLDWVTDKIDSLIKLINKIPGIDIDTSGTGTISANSGARVPSVVNGKLREGFSPRVDSVGIKPPALSQAAPEINNTINVRISDQEIRQISRHESKIVIDKTIRTA